MARVRGKLGCLPNDPSKPRVTLKLRPGAALTPPASVDYYSKFPAGQWGMLGNSTVGDCVAAGAFHAEDVIQYNGQSVTPSFTDAQALAMYSAISGYNPKNPNSDVGATLQSGLDYWRKTGVGGYKIEAYAEFDYRNTDLLKQVIADFGTAYLALEVPSSAMDQFDAGQPWSVVRRSQIEGGHCVPAVGYDANYLYVITWAAVQKVEWAFYAKYFEESWAPVDADWMTSSGKTPGQSLDYAAANAAYQQLTGDTASPFPNVTPTPPTPPVNPPSSDAVTLLTNVKTDLDAQSSAIGTFLASQGSVPPHHHGH